MLALRISPVKQHGSLKRIAALVGDGFVVIWGDAGNGGDSSTVQDQLKNVQHMRCLIGLLGCAFAAMIRDGSVVARASAKSGGDQCCATSAEECAADPSHWRCFFGLRHCSDLAQPRLVDVPVMQVKEEALDGEFRRACRVLACPASGFRCFGLLTVEFRAGSGFRAFQTFVPWVEAQVLRLLCEHQPPSLFHFCTSKSF